MSATVDAEGTAALPVAETGDGPADRWPRGRSTHLAAWVFGAYVAVAGPLLVFDGLMVQRDDVALAWRRSGFDSRWVHCETEGSRIRLAGPRC